MNKGELNEKIFDEIIKYATANEVNRIANDLPSEKELAAKYTFTQEFDNKMQLLFEQQKNSEVKAGKRKTILKIAAIIFIFLAVSTITIANVDAFRVHVLNLFSEMGDRSTTIYIDDTETSYDTILSEDQGLYLPTYIPEGFMVVSVDKFNDYYLITYKNAAETVIELERLPSGSSVGLDIEKAQIEQIVINNELAQYFLKNEVGNLIFKYKENAFLISATISKNELVKMAESMEFRK